MFLKNLFFCKINHPSLISISLWKGMPCFLNSAILPLWLQFGKVLHLITLEFMEIYDSSETSIILVHPEILSQF